MFRVSFWLPIVLLTQCPTRIEAKAFSLACSAGKIEAVRIDKDTGRLIFVDYVDDEKNDTAQEGSSADVTDSENGTERNGTSIPPLVSVGGGNSSGSDGLGNGGLFQNETKNSTGDEESIIATINNGTHNDDRRFRFRNRNLRTSASSPNEEFMNLDLSKMEFEPAWRYPMSLDDITNIDSLTFPRRFLEQFLIDDESIFYIRPCLCGAAEISFGNTTILDDTSDAPEQELYLCQSSASYCVFPAYGVNSSVQCYSSSTDEVVARNLLRLMAFCFLFFILFCFGTIHGQTAADYIKSCLSGQAYADQYVRRLMGENGAVLPRTTRCWAWRRHRFEQDLMQQVHRIWATEANMRERRRRERGLPPPQLELKVKRFTTTETAGRDSDDSREVVGDALRSNASMHATMAAGAVPAEGVYPLRSVDTTTAHSDILPDLSTSIALQACGEEMDDDGNSRSEPTCTICFVPFEEGDRIGDLQCNHEFHVACLKSWVQRKNACPLCNVQLAKRVGPAEDDDDDDIDNHDELYGVVWYTQVFINGLTGRGTASRDDITTRENGEEDAPASIATIGSEPTQSRSRS